jgi:hypothetical protein
MGLRDEDGWRGSGGRVYVEGGTDIKGGKISGKSDGERVMDTKERL